MTTSMRIAKKGAVQGLNILLYSASYRQIGSIFQQQQRREKQ